MQEENIGVVKPQGSVSVLPVIAGAVIGSLVMIASGLTYRVLTRQEAVAVNEIRLDSTVLGGFPRKIGAWVDEDIPLDKAVVDATGADAYINRRYSRNNGLESVSVYIACGANVNALMSHRPTGCYHAAGYQLISRRPMELPLTDRSKLPCFLYQFYRDDVDVRKVIVLHYCYAEGQYFNEVTQVRAMGKRGMHPIRWAAQVEIVASVGTLADSASGLVHTFALDSAASISHLFRSLEEEGRTRE
jgi:hypothetical protein